MNASDQIRTRIRDFVLREFPLAQRMKLADDDSLLESGIIDSMGVLELVTFIETEFTLVLSDDEVASESFESISTLASFVEDKLTVPSEN